MQPPPRPSVSMPLADRIMWNEPTAIPGPGCSTGRASMVIRFSLAATAGAGAGLAAAVFVTAAVLFGLSAAWLVPSFPVVFPPQLTSDSTAKEQNVDRTKGVMCKPLFA